ncbi:hypothetical protein [Rhizocola hellebori]|uniref:hypothetical protein n=1 Tax=Rhizocola hellebori TaxID=1392758 RepID=UPI0019428207|nr:hypothetical protein [Rhizocola hellebori]
MRRKESGRLAFHHESIAGLNGTGPLSDIADRFDPQRLAALITPDPLDPPAAGSRRRLGRRRPMWRLCEDKGVVDAIWAQLGMPYPRSVLADGGHDVAALGAMVDAGDGAVCAVQRAGAAPTSGAEGMWWWQGDRIPDLTVSRHHRLKVMQLVPGVPTRLHGIVFTNVVVAFPPMEVVTLPRPQSGTFLCCGAVGGLADDQNLRRLTYEIGSGLSARLGYRGAFSVDGLMSADGFLPTDLNTRLTSAMEAAAAPIRVQIQAANVVAREGCNLHDVEWLGGLAESAFSGDSVTIYGAANRANTASNVAVRWAGSELVAADPDLAHGQIRLEPSLRGWTLTACLRRDYLPSKPYAGPVAPKVFEFADRLLGTDFGSLAVPFGLEQYPAVPPASPGR